MEQTYQELLLTTDGVFAPNNEFININKESIIHLRPPDYDFFWGCMKLYDVYGINYFEKYMDITMGGFGDFSGGIEEWLAYYGRDIRELEFFGESKIGYRERLSNLIHWMRFFGLSYYEGINIEDLKELQKNVFILYRDAYYKILIQREENKKFIIAHKMKNYYNFENFCSKTFSDFVKRCTIYESKSKVSIDDILKLTYDLPKHSYIVLFYINNQICFIGHTENLLSYIASKSKEYLADSVIYIDVNKDYIDDVLIAVKMFYNYPLDGIRITKVNRKYTTIKLACFVQREKTGITRRNLLDIIHDNLKIVHLENGQEIIDKIALEHILHSSKS